MKVIKYINEIPENARVAIYPNNTSGVGIRQVLRDRRKDVSVICFINTHNESVCGDLRVYTPHTIPEDIKNIIDVVLISKPEAANDILNTLSSLELFGAICYVGLPGFVWYIYNPCDHGPHIYDIYKKHADKAETILQHLSTKEDKRLFHSIMEGCSSLSLYSLLQCYKDGIESFHYFEFGQLNPGEYVIEGGVYDGVTTAAFLDRVGQEGRVFAFEPLGDMYLSDVLTSHPHYPSNCVIVPKALGAQKGKMKMRVAGASTTVGNDGEQSVDVITIDDFVQEVAGRVDFIKFDIEGAELSALKGGMRSIKSFRPIMAISIYHGIDQFFEVPYFLMRHLDRYNFRVGMYNPRGIEVVLYCIPEEREC